MEIACCLSSHHCTLHHCQLLIALNNKHAINNWLLIVACSIPFCLFFFFVVFSLFTVIQKIKKKLKIFKRLFSNNLQILKEWVFSFLLGGEQLHCWLISCIVFYILKYVPCNLFYITVNQLARKYSKKEMCSLAQ